MKVERHAHTYSSSLDTEGCLKMKEKLGSEAFCCQTEEECLGHIMDCDFRKVILEFDQSGSEYSQILHTGHFYLLPILRSGSPICTNLKKFPTTCKVKCRSQLSSVESAMEFQRRWPSL